jgi:hypothetical protein
MALGLFSSPQSDAFKTFSLWLKETEHLTGYKLCAFCFDGGGEYTSKLFQTHLKDNGTIHEMTSADTPEQMV